METEEFIKLLMPIIITGVTIITFLGMIFLLYIQYINKKLLAENKLRQSLVIKHQQALIQSNIVLQEKERDRIAQDLHDDIGSKLNVIHLYFQSLNSNNCNNLNPELVTEINTLLKKTIDSTRLISHNLLPPTLSSFGIFTAIDELIDEISSQNKIDIVYNIDGSSKRRLDSKFDEVNIFRIVQEWISNSIKQNARKISLDIKNKFNQIIIEFEDDGPGYNPNEIKHTNGMGLRNIYNRVSLMNAKLENLSIKGISAKYILKYKVKTND